jgi:AraC family transcriptional regulator of adaptative response/methylated-DNA-[protein]-cysteine methyltransferase
VAALDGLSRRWRKAELLESPAETAPLVEQIFSWSSSQSLTPLHIYLDGTNFQIKVWEALLRIPTGTVISYESLAASLGMPAAARAVSNAVAHNPVAVLIPCHRVIRKMGELGGYQWGTARKKALLGWEQAGALREA